jgi:FimV-like protein
MSLRRWMAAIALVGGLAGAFPALSQVAPTHEVKRGDTLFGIARKAKHEGVSRNQMIFAIWQANQAAFPGGNINVLEVGTVLNIPARETVAAIDPAEADRRVRELLAGPAAPQVASVKPATVAPKPSAPAVPPGQEAAARRYQDGLELERKHDDRGAFQAFLGSAEAGYGPAQRKLGQIYDTGNSAVKRDYQASIRWYQKAREQGIEVGKPPQRTTPDPAAPGSK